MRTSVHVDRMPSLVVPVLALAAWTQLVLLWMYALRLPAIRRVGLKLDSTAPRGAQMATLPPRVRWKSDNYTHLTEHPTVFYAVALALALAGDTSSTHLALAWTYVGLRVVHSLVQGLVNHIPTRFVLFAHSALVLIALTVSGGLVVLSR